MQRSLAELLEESRRDTLPLWSFSVYNFELAASALGAAETLRAPIVLLVSDQSARSKTGERLIDMLVALASNSAAACCVELDHCRDLELMGAALRRGVNSVMADGAGLEFEDNVQFVREAVVMARSYGASVEAELGLITGAEDSIGSGGAGTFTEAIEAVRFVAETEIDCLAVSVGNVHGHYRGAPRINWDLLEEIRASTELPLALHGVSGLSVDDLRHAVRAGVTKFNVNTELREVYFREGRLLLDSFAETLNVLGASTALTERLEEVVEAKIQSLRLQAETPPGFGTSVN